MFWLFSKNCACVMMIILVSCYQFIKQNPFKARGCYFLRKQVPNFHIVSQKKKKIIKTNKQANKQTNYSLFWKTIRNPPGPPRPVCCVLSIHMVKSRSTPQKKKMSEFGVFGQNLTKHYILSNLDIGWIFHYYLWFNDRLQKTVEFVLKFIDRMVKQKI